MEIVIDIEQELYEEILSRKYSKTRIEKAVAKGKPLPENHGRIIDESKINKVYTYTEESINNNIKAICTTITHTDAPTIIEGSESE